MKSITQASFKELPLKYVCNICKQTYFGPQLQLRLNIFTGIFHVIFKILGATACLPEYYSVLYKLSELLKNAKKDTIFI